MEGTEPKAAENRNRGWEWRRTRRGPPSWARHRPDALYGTGRTRGATGISPVVCAPGQYLMSKNLKVGLPERPGIAGFMPSPSVPEEARGFKNLRKIAETCGTERKVPSEYSLLRFSLWRQSAAQVFALLLSSYEPCLRRFSPLRMITQNCAN